MVISNSLSLDANNIIANPTDNHGLTLAHELLHSAFKIYYTYQSFEFSGLADDPDRNMLMFPSADGGRDINSIQYKIIHTIR